MKTAITFVMAVVSVFAAYGKSISLDLRGPVSNSAKVQGLRSTTLAPKSADVGEVAVGDELSLALFDDVKPVLSLKKRMPSSLDGEAFLAEASGYDGVKNAVVLKTAEGLTIDIQDYRNKKVYKVLSMPSGVKVQELDEVPVSCGCDHVALPKAALEKAAAKKNVSNGAVPNGDVVVDILVAFDGNAQSWASSNGGVTNFAILAVQKMNAVLANNNLDMQFRFRLVGVVCVSATSYDLTETLEGAANGYPGWEAIPAKRDAVGADVVTVLIDTGTAYGTTGLGFSLDAPDDRPELKADISWFSEMAYNVCLIRSVSASQTMTHEVGHNMGCGHSDVQASSPGPQLYDYSRGYYFTAGGEKYHTVMAYGTEGPGGTVAPYFSSPDHFYKGVAVGDDLHDNRWTLYNTYAGVAQWRSQKASEITKGEDDVPTEALTWYTSRDTAIAKAKAAGKRVFLIYGRDTCWNTQTTKNESCEQGSVKNLLLKDYVCWYSNCDIYEQNAESRGYFDSSVGSTLPFIAVIDPASNTALATEGGYHTAEALLSMLNGIVAPITYTLRLHRNYSSSDTSIATKSLTYGVAQALPKIQTELKWAPRSGYSFIGWGVSADATGASFSDGQSVKNLASTQGATVHLFALWRKSSPSPFTFSGGEWTQEADGSWRSAAIGDGGRTSASMTVTGPGNLFFLWKTSSEYGYDMFHFYVDGQEGFAGPLSGETDWESLSMDLSSSGPVTLKWEYVKDGSDYEGDDCGWLKDVTWTPKEQPAQTYIVRLHRNNSSRDGATAGRTYTIGKARALPKIRNELKWAPRKGYDFLGWAKTANATTAQYTDGQSLKDLTKTAGATVHLYAVWKAHKYIVRLHRNNSKNDGATTGRAFDYDQVRFLPTMAELKWVRNGYMFLGWSLAQNSSTVKYADGLNVFNLSANDGEELHVWGVWKKAEANAYLLRLHRNNSERDGATAGRQLKLNTNRKLPTVRELGWSRTDATFKGWATTAKNAAAGKVTYKDGATVKNLVKTAGDTAHIYAVWQ